MDTKFYKDVLDHIDDGVYVVDNDRRITYWNAGAVQLTGYAAGDVVGHICSEGILRHVNDAGKQLCLHGCPLLAVMEDGKTREAPVFVHHKDGHRLPVLVRAKAIYDDDGRIVGSVETFSARQYNAVDQSRRSQLDGSTDPVTGLPSRSYGELFLETGVKAVSSKTASMGVLFIDIDNFKAVNDTYGHRTGDAVLRMVGRSLAGGLRRGDMPMRWGGEEFLAVQMGVDIAGLEVTAERLRMLVEHSWIQLDEGQVQVTVSIGATMAVAGDTAEALFDRADRLMYTSKHNGRNRATSDRGELRSRASRPVPGNGHAAGAAPGRRSA